MLGAADVSEWEYRPHFKRAKARASARSGDEFEFMRATLRADRPSEKQTLVWERLAQTPSQRSRRTMRPRKKMLAMPHAQARKTVRMEMTREGRPNEAGPVDGGIPSLFQIARPRPAATDPHCWAVRFEYGNPRDQGR